MRLANDTFVVGYDMGLSLQVGPGFKVGWLQFTRGHMKELIPIATSRVPPKLVLSRWRASTHRRETGQATATPKLHCLSTLEEDEATDGF